MALAAAAFAAELEKAFIDIDRIARLDQKFARSFDLLDVAVLAARDAELAKAGAVGVRPLWPPPSRPSFPTRTDMSRGLHFPEDEEWPVLQHIHRDLRIAHELGAKAAADGMLEIVGGAPACFHVADERHGDAPVLITV